MALTLGADSSSYSSGDPDIDARRRLAMSMLQQGMETSPIGSPWQGLARMAQALIGGWQLNKLKGEDQDAISGMINNLPGLGGAPGPAAASASPIPSAADAKSGSWISPPSSDNAEASPAPASTGHQPASIRNNNPGAQWPGQSASRFGATGFQNLSDGNKIATFPDAVHGAAAQFDLLNSKYAGMPLSDLVRKWSGGNSSPGYTALISKATGLPPNAVITSDMLKNPDVAIPLARVAARWEAGRDFPLDDKGWQEAFQMANGGPATASGPAPITPVASAAMPDIPGAPNSPLMQQPSQAMPPMPVGPTPPMAADAQPQPPPAAAMAGPAPMPPGISPTANQMAGPGAPSTPQFDPQTSAQIRSLLANPRTRQIGMELYQETLKRLQSPDVKMVTNIDGEQVSRMRNPQTGLYDVDPVTGRSVPAENAPPAAMAGPGGAGPAASMGAPPAMSQEGSQIAVPPPPPGVNVAAYRKDMAEGTAKSMQDERDKASGAIEFLAQSQDARNAIDQYGHVIGKFAKQPDHNPGWGGVGQEFTDAAHAVVTGARDAASAIPDGTHIPNWVPILGGGETRFQADNAAREQLDQKFSKLAQAGLKAMYGSRVTNIDVAQQQKTVPQLTDTSPQSALSKLNTIEDASWRVLQKGIQGGTINPSAIPRDVLLRGVAEGKISVPGLTPQSAKQMMQSGGQ